MPTPKSDTAGRHLPLGFRALPIHPPGGPLRVCILVRATFDPIHGHFLRLREHTDATVYLGAVTDAAGRLQEWLELWVQNLDGLADSLPALREGSSNFALDERWRSLCEALADQDPGSFSTGFEVQTPPPLFLDLNADGPVSPPGWELCRDDVELIAAGLPAYTTSLHRYLWCPGQAPPRFVPVTRGATVNAQTLGFAEAWGEETAHLALNPQAGRWRATVLAPLLFDEYADILSGHPWPGLPDGKKSLPLGGAYEGLDNLASLQQRGTHLFQGPGGRAGLFVETFHLKLQLLHEAFLQVRNLVGRQQLPFLNLAADSFRVRLTEIGAGLPVLWTARVILARPGDAFPFAVETTEARYFIRGRPPSGPTLYQPDALSTAASGSGPVRLRQVFSEQRGLVVEGTLVLADQDYRLFTEHDLLWLRLPLSSGRVDLYGHIFLADSLARGELRFRTVPLQVPESTAKALKASEGAAFGRVPWEVVPLLSTPCDLYALGVLSVRTLLVNGTNTLPVALDELLSLARRATAPTAGKDVPLTERIQELLAGDARWKASLGPHRLSVTIPEAEAEALIPAELWAETLTSVIRLFPGLGPYSHCRDLGDAPPLALESIFADPLSEIQHLLRRSRSLLLMDWRANLEIANLLADFPQIAGSPG